MPRWRKCMEQSRGDSREKRGSAGIISTSPVGPSPVVVHFADIWEKCGADEEQLQGLASPPPQSSGDGLQSAMFSPLRSYQPRISTTCPPPLGRQPIEVLPSLPMWNMESVPVSPWPWPLAKRKKNIVSAVEYGPDTQLPNLQNHRLRFYGMGCFVVFVFVTVLVIVAVVKAKDQKGTTLLAAQPIKAQPSRLN